jgi:hypothetical protein
MLSSSWQYWYTPAILYQDILSSALAPKMHFGMAEYVDTPTELWHTRAWGSSIRAASGEFAYASNGDTLFPSEFVRLASSARTPQTQVQVLFARVIFVGLDKRHSSHTSGEVVLTLQPVVCIKDLTHKGSCVQ